MRQIQKKLKNIAAKVFPQYSRSNLYLRRFLSSLGYSRVSVYPNSEYESWIRENEVKDSQVISNYSGTSIVLSIVIPFWNTPDKYLNELMYSLDAQQAVGWELVIVDVSDDPLRSAAIHKWSKTKINYKYHKLIKNFDISTNTNKGIEFAAGDYIAFMDHDDTLSPRALYEVLAAIHKHSPDIIYTDEDKITDNGKIRHSPYFKPDWSPHLFLFTNYTNHFSVVRRQLVLEAGGLDKEFNGSQDYDLLLRIHANASSPLKVHHIAKILYHWREAPLSTATDQSKKSYAYLAGERALQAYLATKHPNATCHAIENSPGYFKQVFEPDPDTIVTVVGDEQIGDMSNAEYMEKLKQLTTTDLEVAYGLRSAQQTDADVIISVNEQCFPTAKTWLDELVGVALLDDVRAVSPRLLSGDRKKIIDAGETASPSLHRFSRYDGLMSDDHTPTGATWFVRDVEAVPSAVFVSRFAEGAPEIDRELYNVVWSHVDFVVPNKVVAQ